MALIITLILFLLYVRIAIQDKMMEIYIQHVYMYPDYFVLINISQHPH
jgi:hypothetical protein